MVINLALFIVKLRPFTLGDIPKKYLALSDYKLISLYWEDINISLFLPNTDKATEWDIQGLIGGKNQLEKVRKA